jgi:hypothetical protein
MNLDLDINILKIFIKKQIVTTNAINNVIAINDKFILENVADSELQII